MDTLLILGNDSSNDVISRLAVDTLKNEVLIKVIQDIDNYQAVVDGLYDDIFFIIIHERLFLDKFYHIVNVLRDMDYGKYYPYVASVLAGFCSSDEMLRQISAGIDGHIVPANSSQRAFDAAIINKLVHTKRVQDFYVKR
jgi:hypothetical protein